MQAIQLAEQQGKPDRTSAALGWSCFELLAPDAALEREVASQSLARFVDATWRRTDVRVLGCGYEKCPKVKKVLKFEITSNAHCQLLAFTTQ